MQRLIYKINFQKIKVNLYLLFKSAIFFILSFAVFYFLENGSAIVSWYQLIITSVLAAITTVIFFMPALRRYILYIANICLILMILTYFFDFFEASKILGNVGFSVLLISVIFGYLPQLIKDGYVKNL